MTKKSKAKISKALRGNKNNVGNHNAGAKTTYGPWAIEVAKKYIKRCIDSYENFVQSESEHEGKTSGSSKSYSRVLNVELPMIAGLAQDLDVDKETVTAWSKLHAEFGRLVRWIRLEQEKRLVNGGVSSKYNSGMSRFVLAAQHGYSETIKHKVGELEKDDLEELSNEELERIANGG